MNGENVEKVYRLCRKREIDRERQWRKSKRCGKIRNVVHLVDFEKAEFLENSPKWLSDGGKGVEDIVAACDACHDLSVWEFRKDLAREKVKRTDRRLLPVLDLVLENRENRKESIWQLMKMLLRKRRNGMRQGTGIGTI